MGVRAQNFEGITTRIPGVYTKSNFPANANNATVQLNRVAVIGKAKGGIPYNATGLDDEQRYNVLSGTTEALKLMLGGDAYYMAEFFFTPTKEASLNKPNELWFFRVDPATQSVSNIKDGSSNNIIDLKSARYGIAANQLSYKVESGTVSGKKITAKFKGIEVGAKDNIIYNYFDIQYTGAGSAATMTINATTLTTTVTGGPGGEDLNITLADFKTVGELVNYIDQLPAYTCVLRGSSSYLSETLDAKTAVDIKTAVTTATAIVQAVIDWFNNETGGEFIASLTALAARSALANNTSFVFMGSGADGTASNTDWANTFELMKKFQINHILVASGDATIHGYADAYCEEMSSITGRKNRTWSAGATITKTKAEKIAEMKAINSYRSEYCCNAIRRLDNVVDGQVKDFDPFFGAALVAGIKYANNITMSATFKTLNILGLKDTFSRPDIEDLLEAGGTVFGKTDDNLAFEVVHNLTTYQSSESLILNLPSMVRTCDAITLDSQSKIKLRISKMTAAPTQVQIEEMRNYLYTNLLPGYVTKGWLTSDPNNGDPAFRNVTFTIDGDRFDFKFTGIVPAPLHYGFITQDFVVVGQV